MKLAIMQPYFFPYIGYWQLINSVDHFVILDDVNYIKRGWINRNRILCDGKEHYITKPVSHASQNRLICDTEFVDDPHQTEGLMRTIRYAYRSAENVNQTNALLSGIMNYNDTNVSGFLEHQIKSICSFLGIETVISRSSDFRSKDHEIGQSGLEELCHKYGFDEYINPIGGLELYDRESFNRKNVKLKFLQTDFKEIQRKIPLNHLDYSIIHLLMNCSLDAIRWMLDEYTLI